MKQLVTCIEPGRLGVVMSKLQEARVGQVRLRQGPPTGGVRASVKLEIAVHDDRLNPAIEAVAAEGSTILLQGQA